MVVLGSSWGRLGVILGPLGVILGPSWGLLGPLGVLLGPSLRQLGRLKTEIYEIAKTFKNLMFFNGFGTLRGSRTRSS